MGFDASLVKPSLSQTYPSPSPTTTSLPYKAKSWKHDMHWCRKTLFWPIPTKSFFFTHDFHLHVEIRYSERKYWTVTPFGKCWQKVNPWEQLIAGTIFAHWAKSVLLIENLLSQRAASLWTISYFAFQTQPFYNWKSHKSIILGTHNNFFLSFSPTHVPCARVASR